MMHVRGWGFVAALLAVGCNAEDRQNGPVMKAPPLRDGPLTLEENGTSGRVVSALAYRGHQQEAIQLVLSSAELRCEDLQHQGSGVAISGKPGIKAFLHVAPVIIEEQTTEKGYGYNLIPKSETWRVTKMPTELLQDFLAASLVDPARDAATPGKRTRLRLSMTNRSGRSVSGSLDVLGCGATPPTIPPREARDLDVRIGEQRLPVRGATLGRTQRGEPIVELFSAGASCTENDTADSIVKIDAETLGLRGDRFTQGYASKPHAFQIKVAEGTGETVSIEIHGTAHDPEFYKVRPPKTDRQRRDYLRHVTINGRVDALRCTK